MVERGSRSSQRVVPLAGPEQSAPSPFSRLPSVEAVLSSASDEVLGSFSRGSAVAAIRRELASLRDRIRSGETLGADELDCDAIASAAVRQLQRQSAPKLRRVVNATGVVLHTNLGRAVLSAAAIDAVCDAAAGSVNLEYDLERGERGDRDALVEEHLCALTGAEAATVVNNNAAALLLTLHTLAFAREVVVSRGELVEIGGSFRIPEIMEASGARLREVGTTNRTHACDYERAIGSETALLMKVHASNYRIVGFSASVELGELRALAEARNVYVVEDVGSGAVVDLSSYGLAPEPILGERLAAGADLVLASGDKLLGGPQCGIIAGRRDLVERLRRSPLKRALRCDKMTLAALEATLRTYRFAAAPEREIPTLRYLLRSMHELRALASAAIPLLAEHLGARFTFETVKTTAEAGSGSQSGIPIPSLAIAVRGADTAVMVERLFRAANPPVIGRIEGGVFLLDVRMVDDPRDLVPNLTTH